RLAELAGGKELELDRTIGAFLDESGDHFKALVSRLLRRLQMADTGRELLCPSDPGDERRCESEAEDVPKLLCHCTYPFIHDGAITEPRQARSVKNYLKNETRQIGQPMA